ncbi:fatty acid amide hydrolase-like isoform X2 [Punica granatum]|uniref:Fatty acid amide hydrolase-like isoform X2 n=1 Tax=Punica granatum TaxID=22663 RepID=A0A6P8CKR0_PUNGR|nr:fatty acid amide hydrolase-like isoform X2 [Punica granatum]
MGKKRVMVPAESLDLSAVKYEPPVVQGPHLTGFLFKLFAKLVEAPVIGSLMISSMKKQMKMDFLKMTEVPESPMFRPEFPPQEPEPNVVLLDEDCKPEDRTDFALKCLPDYSPPSSLNREHSAFRYWKIRDYAYAYRSKLVTPATVAERIIAIIEELSQRNPPAPLLISFDAEDVRKQAAASTKRFEEGKPLSVLDGIFIAIKDDIGCYPYISKVGTRWLHKVSSDNGDAACVSKLRSCGVVLLGKANMHEVRMGASGNNPNYGTARNPHDLDRYTGGSSSGSAAIVASGLCPAALGTDAGGSVRIPSSLCGVVGLKSTFGRTDIGGSFCDFSTVEIIGPITSTVEDAMLVYAAILGASPADRICLQPSVPCLPNLQNSDIFGPVRLGKYTTWFNDVHSTDISDTCEDILSQLSKIHGCEVVEIVIPELLEMHTAHVVAMGTDMIHSLDPYWEDSGKGAKFTYDTRINIALLKSFSASDYVAAQCLRRRMMHHHMDIFKKVDVIVSPTTGMTAPEIPPSALTSGETNLPVTAENEKL